MFYSIGRIDVRAHRDRFQRSIGLDVTMVPYDNTLRKIYQLQQDPSDQSGMAFEFKEINPFGHIDSLPTIGLGLEDAQALMDSLWYCGLRPSEGTGSAGAMAAVQEHLKDMRRLVFDKPGGE